MNRVIIPNHPIFAGSLVAIGIILLVAACSTRQLTGIFFGVNTSPIELTLQSDFEPRDSDEKTKAVVVAAKNFLSTLSESQLHAAVYDFSNNAQRSNWSNFPEGMIPRGGLKLGELSNEQSKSLDLLLAEILSEKGISNLKLQLISEDTHSPNSILKYGTQHFYVAILGEPSSTLPWMFQFGGHHLALNVTIYGSEMTFSPMLTGGEPLQIQIDGERIHITEEEATAAFRLLNSLTTEQKKVAIRSHEVIGLLYGPGEFGKIMAGEGVKGSDLTDSQKHLLIDLINTRLGFINDNDHRSIMTSILDELDDTYFGWWGPQDMQGFAYYRITGPSLILEYSPQIDEGDSVVNHVHSIYRNPQNDYGKAWIGAKN